MPVASVYICTYTSGVAFQWDTKKAQSNAKKHGVAFSDAIGVLEDPRAITIDDPAPDEQSSLRWASTFLDAC